MCGIAGYIRLQQNTEPVTDMLLHRMQKIIEHRGPDGSGIWHDASLSIGLAHRRLKIVDLSDAAQQPMTSKDATIIVCYNGEIYNHSQLRAELENLGYQYFSQSDTETIIYAYQAWGIKCLERFEGMFAFCLVDLKEDVIYIVRDAIGIKPIYFALQDTHFSFASEIKALFQLPWITKKINRTALSNYLTLMASPAPLTIYDGIYKLPAGYYAKISQKIHDTREVTFQQWYCPLRKATAIEELSYQSETLCAKEIYRLLDKAIQKQLVADVPIGIFLSGGVDSSLITAFAARTQTQVQTFNIAFSDGPEHHEMAWARKISQQYQTAHHEIMISEFDAFSFFEKMAYHQDEPLGDCVAIPLFYLSQAFKSAGFTVALLGDGADELFCGYTTYAKYLDATPYYQAAQKIVPKKIRSLCAQILAPHLQNALLTHDLMNNFAAGRGPFWGGAIAFTESIKQNFLIQTQFSQDPVVQKIYPGMLYANHSYDLLEFHSKKTTGYNTAAQMAYLELKHRLPELLLTRADKMTMAASIEGRFPFLDQLLVEYALHIPQKYKYYKGETKYILKKVAEELLPHDIIYRKKIGFAAPTQHWFTQGTYFKPYFLDMLNTKEQALSEFIDIRAVRDLYEKTVHGAPRADQLWVLQTLMASDLL